MLGLQTNSTKKKKKNDVAQHDWKWDKFNFWETNHIVPYHVVNFVCKRDIFLDKIPNYKAIFFRHVHTRVVKREIRISNFRFIRHDLQSIELSFWDIYKAIGSTILVNFAHFSVEDSEAGKGSAYSEYYVRINENVHEINIFT